MITKSVVECRDGWASLYEPIIEKIIEHDSKIENVNNKIGVAQVKEKFGIMCINVVNVHNCTSEITEMINNAIRESGKICEYCGTRHNVGSTRNNWYKTCCKSCWEKYIKTYNDKSIWKEILY